MTLTRPPTNEDCARHARALAVAFDVVLREDPTLKYEVACAAHFRNGARVVFCSPVVNDTSYAVALHELGHHIHPSGSLHVMGRDRNVKLMITEETSAWEWAQHYALDWTVAMEQVKTLALATYQEFARNIKEFEARTGRDVNDYIREREQMQKDHEAEQIRLAEAAKKRPPVLRAGGSLKEFLK